MLGNEAIRLLPSQDVVFRPYLSQSFNNLLEILSSLDNFGEETKKNVVEKRYLV